MRHSRNPSDLAKKVKDLISDEGAAALLDEIEGPAATSILEDLIQDSDSTVRGWATWAAATLLGTDAVPLLVKALGDRDVDVRDVALLRLLRLDPAAARRAIAKIRSKLASADDFEVASALWALAELRDAEALPLIDSIAENPRVPWLEKPAHVASCLIRGEVDAILSAIKAHDHRRMRELAHGAAIIGTRPALELLRLCQSSAEFDEQCRRWCEWFADWADARSLRVGGRR